MFKVIILAEHDHSILCPQVRSLVSAARKLNSNPYIQLVVMGYSCQPVVEQAIKLLPVAEVIWIDHRQLGQGTAEVISDTLLPLCQDVRAVIGIANAFGKNSLPRVAAKLGTCHISDVIEILSPNMFKRPVYAGNAIETLVSTAQCKVMTIRAAAFEPVVPPIEPTAVVISIPIPKTTSASSQFLNREEKSTNRPELSNAKIIISGGRGLGDRDHFKLIEQLADALGAAVGATRAAVDAGYISNTYQIGQTGKTVAPELYIAIGISGAVQHIAGIKDSKVIVAINHDPNASIFQIADYGLVGDLFMIVPELIKALSCL